MTDPIPAALAALQQSRTSLDLAINLLLDPWRKVDQSGLTDVTDAVQQAIDDGRPIPAGRYLIDPVRSLIAKRDVMADPNAIFIAKPNGATHYCLLKLLADGIHLTGGQFVGDRMAHVYDSGSAEWCYGIRVDGDGCSVSQSIVNRFPGDGFGIAGQDCTLRSVVSTYNGRQGLSGFGCGGLRVFDSEFSYTGALNGNPGAPNGPFSGVDIEPDKAENIDVEFYRCRMIANRTGFLVWLRSNVGGAVSAVLADCELSANANGVWTKANAGAITMTALRNKLAKNTSSAFKVDQGSAVTIGNANVADANIITGMTTRTPMTKTGIVTAYDIQAINGGKASVGMNTYQ